MNVIHRHIAIVCLLLAGCSASNEEQAFESFMASRQAIMAGDLETLKTLVSAEHAAELEGPGADMMLEIAQSAMPQEIRLVKSSFADGEGTLTLAGRNIMDDGEMKLAIPAQGTVRVVEEAGGWKIAKEDWNMQFDLAVPIFEVRPFLQEGQRPVALKVLEGHASGATKIVHTPNWKYLITISYGDYSLRVWDVQTGQPLAARTLESRPTSLTVSADGQTLLTTSVDGDVFRWPLDTFGDLGTPKMLLRGVGKHAALSSDGKWLAVTSYDEPVVVYDMETLRVVQTLGGSEKLRSTTFSPSGELLAGSEGSQLLIWGAGNWSAKSYTLDDVSPDSSNGSVVFSADGRYLGVPCGDSSIIIFDVEKRSEKHNFFVSGAAALSLQFSPDTTMFATAQNNQQINLWSMAEHKRIGYILSKKANATALRFSPDGRYLVAGHEDREIVFWGVAANDEKAVATRAKPANAASLPRPGKGQQPERVTLLSQTNYLNNPHANQHQQFWKSSGSVAIEDCEPGNPCFATRWDGKLVGTAELPADAAGKYMLLIGSAAAERAHEGTGDQTGEAYIHGYGESLDPKRVRGKHYSARTLQTATRRANTWETIWGVFEVGEGIRKINFEIRQADGRSAKTGSASRFDDLGVYLFDTEQQAESFVTRYESEVGRVAAAAETQASQPVANLAPPETAVESSQPADPGSVIISCHLDGRVVFMRKAQCAQAGGR
ncbi:MAG: WD40 repeat domain-containing protein [Planctomycetota bacterium]|jgi:WD40 repeat protein